MTSVDIRRAILTWSAPTQYDDGSPLTVSKYKVYWGTSPGSHPNSTGPITGTTTTLDLAPGTYYFVVTALDAAGAESGFSNVASKTVL